MWASESRGCIPTLLRTVRRVFPSPLQRRHRARLHLDPLRLKMATWPATAQRSTFTGPPLHPAHGVMLRKQHGVLVLHLISLWIQLKYLERGKKFRTVLLKQVAKLLIWLLTNWVRADVSPNVMTLSCDASPDCVIRRCVCAGTAPLWSF